MYLPNRKNSHPMYSSHAYAYMHFIIKKLILVIIISHLEKIILYKLNNIFLIKKHGKILFIKFNCIYYFYKRLKT